MLLNPEEYKIFVVLFPVFLLSLIKSRETIEEQEEEVEKKPQDYNLQLVKIWHDSFRFKSSGIYDCDCCQCTTPIVIEKRKSRKKKKEDEQL